MTRTRLPDRRPNETIDLFFGGLRFSVSFGFYPDGRIGEVFASGAKSGCDMDYLLDDACVALSLLLQHGVEPAVLANSMGRTEEIAVGHFRSDSGLPATRPASIIGALADRLTEYAAIEGRGAP
ncbi:MAG: ribonucleotide reductase [Rhodospirillaceae bacterium]